LNLHLIETARGSNDVNYKDNKPLDTEADNLTELAAQAREFVEKRLPVLRKLQIA
jgi:hypothetical protein